LCLRFGIVPSTAELIADIEAIGHRHGIDRLGVAPASPMLRAREALRDRRERGLDDGMQFTFRDPDRSTDPGRAVAGARSVIVAARPYEFAPPTKPDVVVARVARYAWTDHYAPLRSGLREIARHLRSFGHRAVAFADDNSMVDREAAWLGGIGWFGKNANLLVPGAGSWFVLGSVVTTAELTPSTPIDDGCGSCRRCLDGCPTGAIIEPGVIDGRRCIAWQLQRPGTVPVEMRIAIGDRIYGCDDCQEVCPPTVRSGRRGGDAEAHEVARLDGEPDDLVAWVPVIELLEASDDEILAAHGRWYIADRDPRWLRRNALIVLGNVGDASDAATTAVLERYVRHDDPVLRSHAVWAMARIGRHDLIPVDDLHQVGDPTVRDEIRRAGTVPSRTTDEQVGERGSTV
jgi:epoxyqueuosine reductase